VIPWPMDDLRAAFGLGVAGSFAGHLEQAGVAGSFAGVPAAPEAPKGIFPWYAPGDPGFLGAFPLAHDRVDLPAYGEGSDLQIEPEAGVLFEVDYGEDGRPSALRPRALGAFNDCSIRRPGAAKISHKKNWGPGSKGSSMAAAGRGPVARRPDGGPAPGELPASRRQDACLPPRQPAGGLQLLRRRAAAVAGRAAAGPAER
jgi:hypothetical protein